MQQPRVQVPTRPFEQLRRKKKKHNHSNGWKCCQFLACVFLTSLLITILCLAAIVWKNVNDLNNTIHDITEIIPVTQQPNNTAEENVLVPQIEGEKTVGKRNRHHNHHNKPTLSKTISALGNKRATHINLGKVQGTDGNFYTGLVHIHYNKPVMGPSSNPNCYDLNSEGYRWKTTKDYNIDPYNTRSLPEEWVVSVFYLTAQNWNSVLSNFTIFGSPIVDESIDKVTYTEQSNGLNEFFFGYIDIDGVIALTISWGVFDGPIGGRYIIECDIIFNDRDFSFGDGDSRRDVMDLQNIATHEFGHCTGLSDLYTARCSDDTMYGYSSRGETKKRQITEGARTGLKINYEELDADSIPPDLSENMSSHKQTNLFMTIGILFLFSFLKTQICQY
jgi:hypothetical protein